MARVLVTGANRGIGAAIAAELTRVGHHVFAGVRDVRSAGDLLGRCVAFPGTVEAVELDVRSDESVDAAFAAIDDSGPLDVLVNNAAIPAVPGVVEFQPIDHFREVMETDFYGPLRTMKAVIGGMRERRSGTIVNISSIGSLTATGMVAPYVLPIVRSKA